MSRERLRAPREDTRQRLYVAAAEVFAARGVAAATIEQITAAAGFTRGAFYSNFESKDDLLLAMLEDHARKSQEHNRALLAAHRDPAGFVDALRHDRGRRDPLHANPLLQVELMLHVARRPRLRPALRDRLRAMRTLLGELAAAALAADDVDLDVEAEQVGMILLALEDGLRLHRLIDPSSTPASAFTDALALLLQAVTRPATGATAVREASAVAPARRPGRGRT